MRVMHAQKSFERVQLFLNSGPQMESERGAHCCESALEREGSPSARPSACYSCSGLGTRAKRVNKEGRWRREQRPCNACHGTGFIVRSRRRGSDGKFVKKSVRKSFPSFVAPGPMPRLTGQEETLEGEDEELCYLTGNWRIFQHINKHRYSTDDIVTSWVACHEAKMLGYDSPLMLDMGCGIGSVLLSNAWQLPGAVCVGIEAQHDRYTMAMRSVQYNIGVYPDEQTRVRVVNSDLRVHCAALDCHLSGFDVITGTPPYFGVTQGVLPGCRESAGCLFELRGGVEGYCEGMVCIKAYAPSCHIDQKSISRCI